MRCATTPQLPFSPPGRSRRSSEPPGDGRPAAGARCALPATEALRLACLHGDIGDRGGSMISAQAVDAAIATGHTQASGRRARRSGKGLLALALGAILLAATACGGPAGARTRSSDGAAAPA